MGGNQSIIPEVNFMKSNPFYVPGEQVSGEVSIQNTSEKVKLDEIFIELIGVLGFTTQESRSVTDSAGNSTTQRYTAYHHIPFLTMHSPLAQPNPGEDRIILTNGQYTWPFEFSLPETLPPSTEPNSAAYPNIKYSVKIVLDKPWYKRNLAKTYPLMICPRVNLLHMNNAYEMNRFENSNRKDLQLEGYLMRNSIVPGDSLSIQINLHNPKRIKIKRIQASFIQHRHTAVDGHDEIIFSTDLPGLHEFNGTNFQNTIDLPVPPIYLAPTYAFSTPWKNREYNLNISYELKLTVKAHGFFTNFSVGVIVLVGTDPISKKQMDQQIYGTAMSMNTNLDYKETDVPPNYESVVKYR